MHDLHCLPCGWVQIMYLVKGTNKQISLSMMLQMHSKHQITKKRLTHIIYRARVRFVPRFYFNHEVIFHVFVLRRRSSDVYVHVLSQTAAWLHLKLWFSSACNANIMIWLAVHVSKRSNNFREIQTCVFKLALMLEGIYSQKMGSVDSQCLQNIFRHLNHT